MHTLERQYREQRTDLVPHVARCAPTTPAEMRAITRGAFRRLCGAALWREEFNRRLMVCNTHAKLAVLAEELSRMSKEDQLLNAGADELARGAIIAVRWHQTSGSPLSNGAIGPAAVRDRDRAGVQRHERSCRLGCCAVGGLAHFLKQCSALTSERVGSVNLYEAAAAMDIPLRLWREIERKLMKSGVPVERADWQVTSRE